MHEEEGDVDSLAGVAVVGMAGRFPGAQSVAEFWHNLRNGMESVVTIADEDLLAAGVDAATLRDPRYVKRVAVVEHPELFDAPFFGFTPREAEVTDPQHRLFLECAWEALEAAGYDPERYAGRIGVYAGASTNTYLLNLYSHPELIQSIGGLQATIASDKDHLTTLVSYKLNLTGPSVTVQTACSTSLVAVHLACQSLLGGECDMALAGGVCVSARQKLGYLHQEGSVLSPDGHCRAFDAGANGTTSGNGVGVVLLKRLEEALRDGDRIRAVIRGSAVNNDGSRKVGYTAPSVEGQAAVIAEALAVAGVSPETVTYVEAHGTATPLGDPIEIAALTRAFRSRTKEKGFCAVGAVKSNIGHLDAAAGVASLIKTVLALEHGEIPPSLYYREPNPRIDFASSPFFVNAGLREWETRQHPRRAGVSAFGIGGTNAHAVLEEAPPASASGESRRGWQLLTLSAKTETALESATRRLAEHLGARGEQNLADVSFTLALGRREFKHRRVVLCRRPEDAAEALAGGDPKLVLTARGGPRELPVVFMFPGQGSQYVGMGRGLYATEPLFRAEVDRCCELLKPPLGLDLRELLYPAEEQSEWARRRLGETRFTQPALFVMEYALARLWMSWGVRPAAMIGHSVGEYVAACLADVMSPTNALRLVTERGRLMQEAVPAGAMLSAEVTAAEAETLLAEDERLSLAAVNGVRLCVFSGPPEPVSELARRLAERGVAARRLETSHAFHSAMMDRILGSFAEIVGGVSLRAPKIPYVSNVSGEWVRPEEATDARYWTKHLRETVRFADGLKQLNDLGGRVLLEVGPGNVLSTLARQPEPGAGATATEVLSSSRHPQEQQPDELFLLKTLGRLWLLGVRIDWEGFFGGEKRRRVELPTYPFERQRYWVEERRHAGHPRPAGRKANVGEWLSIPSWKRTLPPAPLAEDELLARPQVWLIFFDACGLGRALARRLRRLGQRVIGVEAGGRFAQPGDDEYHIRADEREDYERLWQSLADMGLTPGRVLHLWGVSPAEAGGAAADFDHLQTRGFYSLLYTAQVLARQSFAERVRLLIVSNQVQPVTGEESLCPAKATVLGPCRVIPQELRNITCRHVDIVLGGAGDAHDERTVEHLLAEAVDGAPEVGVAYRGGHRWVQTFEPVRPEERRGGRVLLREQGVYLITGGLGNVGSVLAEYLARTVRAKLVLTGRTPLPLAEQWARWLAEHDAQDETSRRIRLLMALEEAGAEVMVAPADVSEERQMRALVERAHERFGALHGIIHAAAQTGVASFGEVLEADRAHCEAQFRPKAHGLEVLARVLEGRPLDFFLLMSSLSSVLGGLGLVAYSAANTFMDAFAHRQARTSRAHWASVNWGAWEFGAEGGRGHGADSAIKPEEGAEAFRLILSQGGLTQVAVSPDELEQRIARWIRFDPAAEASESRAERSSPATRPAGLESAYAPPRNGLERQVAEIWQELFGIERVGIHDNFFELGGHSLLATQLVARARETLDVAPPLRTIYESPTVAEWAEAVLRSRLEQVDGKALGGMLAEVRGLSESEARELLAAEERADGGQGPEHNG